MTHLRHAFSGLVIGAAFALAFFHIGQAGAAGVIDPATNPAGFLDQLLAFAKTSWPIAVALGAYGLLEFATVLGKNVAFFAWLGQGRTTLIIAGAMGVLGAALNAYLGSGTLQAALVAAVVALAAYWHPQATAVETKRLAQGGFARLGTMLAIAAIGIGITSGCLSSSQVKTGGTVAGMCALSDLEKYAGQVEGDLLSLDFTAALDKLKADNNLTQDAINCLVAAVVAVFQAQQPAGAALSPVVVHGKAYLGAHKTALLDVPVPLAAAWLVATPDCESPRERPAVDCKPWSPEIYDGCHWTCQ